MNQFFRIGLAMAITVCMISCVQGKGGKAGKAAGAVVALRAAKNSDNDNDEQPTTTPQTGAPQAQASAAPAPAASVGIAGMQTSGQLIAVPLTKMETIIKNVTSCKYPYRCSVFAGDYCQRQCTVICAPPL